MPHTHTWIECIRVGVLVLMMGSHSQPFFSQSNFLVLYSFVSSFSFLSVAFVCGFYWLYSFTHSHHCNHQRKILHCGCECEANASHDHKTTTTTTLTLVSDLSSGISSIRIQKLSSFLSRCVFPHELFIRTESDVIILRVVIVKTISFKCIWNKSFLMEFLLYLYFSFGNWNKCLNMHKWEAEWKRSIHVRKRCMP